MPEFEGPPTPIGCVRTVIKKPDFKHVFECSNNDLTHIWFVFENAALCEEIRGPMKEKMDALLGQ